MTSNLHKASPDSWKYLQELAKPSPESWGQPRSLTADCIMELKGRLDSMIPSTPKTIEKTSNNFLDKVAEFFPPVLDPDTDTWVPDTDSARDVLLFISAELEKKAEGHLGNGIYWANWLENEANR